LLRAICLSKLQYCGTILQCCSQENIRFDCNLNLLFNFLIAHQVHVEKQFFPWHRWYLLQFENLFRRIDSRVTLPYWDWSIRSQKLWHIGRKSVWNNYPWGLGGNGTGSFNCVDKGPFSKKSWRLAPKSGGGCLRRKFMGGYKLYETPHQQNFPTL
jgi:hypothetical protein